MTATAPAKMQLRVNAPASRKRPGAWPNGGMSSMSEADPSVPYGYCHCGCGRETPLARQSHTKMRRVKGEPIRFINGHQGNGRKLKPLMERLWAKVDKRGPGECWLFTGYRLNGYGWIGSGRRGEASVYAHRTVLIATVGPPPFEGAQARHLCGNRPCCNPAHLAWGDQSDNEWDKLTHGRSNRGSRHGMSKLTADDVAEIRHRCAAGERQRDVGADYGIAQQSVSEIVTGRTWGWMKGGEAE